MQDRIVDMDVEALPSQTEARCGWRPIGDNGERVDLESDGGRQPHVCLSVADSGHGLPFSFRLNGI